ncbi:MAG TPA: 3-isopropylmalate dehydrogenase [Myxococcales bacterium]|jgi:3-isopropylmalate dehydrogenase|nr:3-isopropylmalate dehydrogenase [Myxococcales bacterium]
MRRVIAVLPGDGVGPEVTAQAVRVLQAVISCEVREAPVGGIAIDQSGVPLPEQTLAVSRAADAVLLGAVGGPRWATDAPVRPEQGLLALRRGLGVFANLRPASIHPRLVAASPLKETVLRGVDVLVVRELTGGIYFGAKRRDAESAEDLCTYTATEIARVVRVAARLARSRRKRLTSVDKANVLETSRLWREVTARVVRQEFPDVALDHQLVDSCALRLVQEPSSYDVIVTENLFGDILTDLAAVLGGSIGMLPSASLGETGPGLYEPVHGSAPDIAGKGIANPYGAIASVALLLRHSLRLEREALAVEAAVFAAVERGALTPDLGGTAGTREAGDAVLQALKEAR